MDDLQLSITAASWCAAQCVRYFCRVRGIASNDIETFCQYLEDAPIATSIIDWDKRGNGLMVTGLGDPMPPGLESEPALNELLCDAREVTASQMYGAWHPDRVKYYLRRTAQRAGLDADQVVRQASSLHRPDQSGWGSPVTEAERATWSFI